MRNPIPMPGTGCRYWLEGRCFYEEALNPGLLQEYQCVVLNLLERRFDAFVIRGEIMGLSQEDAGRIWERRMTEFLNIGGDCANFVSLQDDHGDFPCLHFREGVCVLRLPSCPGRCRRFLAGQG